MLQNISRFAGINCRVEMVRRTFILEDFRDLSSSVITKKMEVFDANDSRDNRTPAETPQTKRRCGNIASWLCPIRNKLIRELLSEFLGTFILMVFGIGSVAQSVLSNKDMGGMLSINFGWGIGVMLGCIVAGKISGAHINPAVSLAMAVVDKFPWFKVPLYTIAQLLGSFTASAVLYFVYYEALDAYDGGHRYVTGDLATAGIWSTYPQQYLSLWGGLLDQIVGTALLLFCVCAIVDPKNTAIPGYLSALYVGFLVTAIGICFGMNAGYAINPARDFAPRVFTCLAGWGTEVFTVQHWWWVPIIGPYVGGVLGALLYRLLIELHWDSECGETSYYPEDQHKIQPMAKDLEDIPYADADTTPA